APEAPVTTAPALVVAERGGVLDREIGNATPRVERPRLDEGIGRTGLEAASARATAVGLEGEVGDQLGIREDHADERERADGRIDQHRVLPDPPQPGALRPLALRVRTRVHLAARP